MYQQPPRRPQQPLYGRPQWGQQPPQSPNASYPQEQSLQYQSGADPFNEQHPRPGMLPSPLLYQPTPPMYPPLPVQRPLERRRTPWIIIAIIVGAIVIFGGTANALSKTAATPVSTDMRATRSLVATAAAVTLQARRSKPTPTPASSSSGDPSSNLQVAEVGQTISVDNMAATLVSVMTLAAGVIIKPGNEFIVVHVKLMNKSSGEKAYNSFFEFHVRSGSGNITNEEMVPPRSYRSHNQLNAGKLSAGGSVEGDIVFQIPINDHKAQLTWQPSILGHAADNVWNLGL